MLIFHLITTAISTVFYGIIATVALMSLLFIILRLIKSTVSKNILFYPVGSLLAVLLVAQFTMLFGARKAIAVVDDMETGVIMARDGLENTVASAVPQEYLNELTDRYPLIGLYIEGIEVAGNTAGITVNAIAGTVREELSAYIWRRVWWIAGSVLVACVIALMFPCTVRQKYCSSHYDASGSSMGETNEWGI